MDFDQRFHRGWDRDELDRLPYGTVACGRGLRRTGMTHRDLAREYDPWIERPLARSRDASERDPP
jgi:hypothetical protein